MTISHSETRTECGGEVRRGRLPVPVQNLKSAQNRRRAAEAQRPESDTKTGLAGRPTGLAGQGGTWVTINPQHGHHTAGSASASVGSTGDKRRAREAARDSESQRDMGAPLLFPVSQSSQSVSRHGAGIIRPGGPTESIPSQVRG